MISKLKKRPRPDTHRNQIRKARRGWDRAIYLSLLAIFFLGLFNYAFGDRLLLRADGLVLRNQTAIATTILVRVTDVEIRPGQNITKGSTLFRAESGEMLDRLTEYTLRVAEFDKAIAALQGQARLTHELLPLAQSRAVKTRTDLDVLLNANASGLVTAAREQDLQDQAYSAQAEYRRLFALSQALETEITAVSAARHQAQTAFDRLSVHYADGMLRAPVSGVIVGEIPSEGEVFNPGERMTTLLSGDQYVLAYLPDRYLFNLVPGQSVLVSTGVLNEIGRIEEILPFSQSLPDEFQNTFRALERRQLARISLASSTTIPTHATVRITQDFAFKRHVSDSWASLRKKAGKLAQTTAAFFVQGQRTIASHIPADTNALKGPQNE